MITAVRVKGGFKINQKFKKILEMLRINKKHHCALLEDNKINKGMIKKVRHLITWGEIEEEVLKKLIKKRGRHPGNKRLEYSDKKLEKIVKELLKGKKSLADYNIKPVFRLSPPKKGWRRGTTKLEYPRGALGPRGKDINNLLIRMI